MIDEGSRRMSICRSSRGNELAKLLIELSNDVDRFAWPTKCDRQLLVSRLIFR